MIKLRFSVITIIFLCVLTTISSILKYHRHEVDNKNTQNAEVMLDLNTNQSQYEQGFQDQQDSSKKIKNQTSKHTGVSWNKDHKKWKAQLGHNKKKYYGGYFDDEEHAAMKVNLLCDKCKIERKNPSIEIEPDAMQRSLSIETWESKVPNKTSKYTAVSWHKDKNKWKVQLKHKGKEYFGGYFDNEKHAAMKVNLICDKYGKERKNWMINIEPDAIQKIPNQTSIYSGVTWNKKIKCWQTQLQHNKKQYYGGLFDKEEHAAMKINSICDTIEIKHKNPEINKDIIQKKTKSEIHQYAAENIVNEQVKVKDENIFDGFKDECKNRFIQSNDQEKCTAKEFQNLNAKRKRKQNLILNDDVKEVKEENEWFEKIQQDYTKMQD